MSSAFLGLAPREGWNSIGLPRSPFGLSHLTGLPRSQPRPPHLPLSSYLCFAREEQICDPSCNGQTAKIGRKSQPAQRLIPGRILTNKRGAASTPPEPHVHWASPSQDQQGREHACANVWSSFGSSEKRARGCFIHHHHQHHFVFCWRLFFFVVFFLFCLCLKSASGDDFTTFLILFDDTEKQ